MKKKLRLIILTVLCLCLIGGVTGCAVLDDTINEIKGNLVGNGYTIRTYDDYGSKVMTTTGNKINIQGNPVKTTSYSSDGSVVTGYEMSSVITINIDGKEIQSCGDTCIFEQIRERFKFCVNRKTDIRYVISYRGQNLFFRVLSLFVL